LNDKGGTENHIGANDEKGVWEIGIATHWGKRGGSQIQGGGGITTGEREELGVRKENFHPDLGQTKNEVRVEQDRTNFWF